MSNLIKLFPFNLLELLGFIECFLWLFEIEKIIWWELVRGKPLFAVRVDFVPKICPPLFLAKIPVFAKNSNTAQLLQHCNQKSYKPVIKTS